MSEDSLQSAIREGAVDQLAGMSEEDRAELEGTCVGCGDDADEGLFCDECSDGLDELERLFSGYEWEVFHHDPDKRGDDGSTAD